MDTTGSVRTAAPRGTNWTAVVVVVLVLMVASFVAGMLFGLGYFNLTPGPGSSPARGPAARGPTGTTTVTGATGSTAPTDREPERPAAPPEAPTGPK